jgi:hypothetical protein
MAKINGDFIKVAETKDIRSTKMKAVEVAGENICLINVEGKYYAIGNVCTHEGGPLAEGTLEGYDVLGMAPNLILELARLQDHLQMNQSQPMK